VCFTLSSGALIYLVEKKDLIKELLKIELTTIWALGFSTALLLGLSACLAFWVITPRLGASWSGIIFWRDIANHPSAAKYADAVNDLPSEDLANQLLKHCYDISLVCNAKYLKLRQSIVFAGLGFLPFLALLSN
jgi:hypothetical protein